MYRIKLPTDLPTPLRSHDFCDPSFDNGQPHTEPLRKLYILYSTPRSGSTLLCDKIYHESGLVVHEYLQPFQYLPYLAERFSAVDEVAEGSAQRKIISLDRYLKALTAARAQQGVLGMNCHLSHLIYLHAFINHAKKIYPDIVIEQDYLYRKNLYRQAASYAIARKTKIWSQLEAPEERAASMRKNGANIFRLKIQAAVLHKKLKRQHRLMMSNELELPGSQPISYRYSYEELANDNSNKIILSILSRLDMDTHSAPNKPVKQLVSQSTDTNIKVAESIKRFYKYYLALGILLGLGNKVRTTLAKMTSTSALKSRPISYFLEV